MSAKIINGMEIREAILEEIKKETSSLLHQTGSRPGLVTILIGEHPASRSYVRLKIKTAKELGFYEIQDTRPENFSEKELLDLISQYNGDPAVHGILVQLPLPPHIDEKKVIYAIDPEKDVDGFHPVNIGRLFIGPDQAKFPPCTPAGICEMLKRSDIRTAGKKCTIVGRSNIVGKPLALMLMQKGMDATVTVCHSRSLDLKLHCEEADILVAAAGSPGLIKPGWIKPGAAVIDVGINRVGEKIHSKTGKKTAVLKGDVDFDAACEVAGAVTPVPRGVGPMTIAMLMKNTLKAFQLSRSL